MNSRWGRWSNLWFYADTETLSPEDNPSQTGSSVDRGEFRPIIKDFSFPLISLGHFYAFFSLPTSLQPWAADLHTLAGRRGGLERRCPLPLHFLPSSLSATAGRLSLIQGTYSSLSSPLTRHYSHTRLLPCAKTHSHMVAWNAPKTLEVYRSISVFLPKHIDVVLLCHKPFYLTLWIFYFRKSPSSTVPVLAPGACVDSRGACCTLVWSL